MQHTFPDMLLQLCFKVLIYYYLHPLPSFAISFKYYCLLPVVLFQTGISFCGKQFLLPHQLSNRIASLVHLRTYSALVSLQILQLDTREHNCLPCASQSVRF